MEDKSIKFTRTIFLASSLFIIFCLSSAVEKEHFLSINTNVKNDILRAEITILMEKFDLERQKNQDYYTKEIEKLKEEKRSEVKAIKKKFGEKRGVLFAKYGKERKLMHSKPDRTNIPDKKPLRKPK